MNREVADIILNMSRAKCGLISKEVLMGLAEIIVEVKFPEVILDKMRREYSKAEYDRALEVIFTLAYRGAVEEADSRGVLAAHFASKPRQGLSKEAEARLKEASNKLINEMRQSAMERDAGVRSSKN